MNETLWVYPSLALYGNHDPLNMNQVHHIGIAFNSGSNHRVFDIIPIFDIIPCQTIKVASPLSSDIQLDALIPPWMRKMRWMPPSNKQQPAKSITLPLRTLMVAMIKTVALVLDFASQIVLERSHLPTIQPSFLLAGMVISCRNAVLHQDDNVASLPPHILMMWQACHLRIWLNSLDPITRVASDLSLSRVCQKYHCVVWCIIGLGHLPPQMKNQHGLNQEKNFNKEKNNLSIESSDVTHVVSLDTNNLSVRV